MPSAVQKSEGASRNPSNQNQQQNQGQGTSGGPSTPNNGTTSPGSDQQPQGNKANRPSDSRFKQQKLKAWQPILTAGTVLPTFFLIGLVFIPVGVVLFFASKGVQEHAYDYTVDCKQNDIPCKDIIKNKTLMDELLGDDEKCHCELIIKIPDAIPKPVFVYYGLSNFYQNHRRYVKSRDDVQLLGDYGHSNPDCAPFEKNGTDKGKVIYPCGAVANSMFNDTFVIARVTDANDKPANAPVNTLMTDIAWKSDYQKKFFNPTDPWSKVEETVAKPQYWSKPIWDLSGDEKQNGVKNEPFIVWMRTAALPTFRKLHSRIDHSQDPFKEGLPAGNYSIKIEYNFPVDAFDGKKRFIISNTSWAGGKNPFLGVAYIVVGSLCILTGLIFLLIHLKFGKSLTELASVS